MAMFARRSTRIRIASVAGAVALIAAACGGGGDSSADTTPADAAQVASGTNGNSVESSPLDAFGDLIVANGEPVSGMFDAAGGTLELSDGASVGVTSGAFSEQTTVTAETFELDFASFVDDGPSGMAYVVSTVDDIELGAPVTLEVPIPAADVKVTQYADGQWSVIEPVDGPTTVVPIPHFSEVTTLVTEAATGVAVPSGPEPEGFVPALFLQVCVLTVSDQYSYFDDEYSSADFIELGLSVCTRALIDKLSPVGESVSIECVGSNIGGEVDIVAAIDACVTADTDQDVVEDTAVATPSTSSSDGQDEAPPSGSEIRDGTYTGEFDLAAVLPDADFVAAAVVGANELSVEIRDGELYSVAGAVAVAVPFTELGGSSGGVLCPSDDVAVISADGADASRTGTVIEAVLTFAITDIDFAEGDDCDEFSEQRTENLAVEIVFDEDNATLLFLGAFWGVVELTRD